MSGSVRPEKRRRLMQELPGSTLDRNTTTAQDQSDVHDCDTSVRQQTGSVGKHGTENDNIEISSSESLETPRDASSQSVEMVCFGAVSLPPALL